MGVVSTTLSRTSKAGVWRCRGMGEADDDTKEFFNTAGLFFSDKELKALVYCHDLSR